MTRHEMTTWDGKAISPEPPHGAAIVVYRRKEDEIEFLILHRAHAAEPDGEWAWTPPAGARIPGETIDDCARRELLEETGLRLSIHQATEQTGESWVTYWAEAEADDVVVLDVEHDQYAWVSAATAVERCLPERVGIQIERVFRDLSSLHG